MSIRLALCRARFATAGRRCSISWCRDGARGRRRADSGARFLPPSGARLLPHFARRQDAGVHAALRAPDEHLRPAARGRRAAAPHQRDRARHSRSFLEGAASASSTSRISAATRTSTSSRSTATARASRTSPRSKVCGPRSSTSCATFRIEMLVGLNKRNKEVFDAYRLESQDRRARRSWPRTRATSPAG